MQRRSKQGCLLVCKKSDYNSDSFKTHGCTRDAALGAGWLNCLSCGTKYSPTPPALESGKTREYMRSVRGECSSGTRRQYLRLSGRVPLCKSAGEHWAPICRAYYASTHLPTGQTPGISCPAIAHNPDDQHLEHIMPLQNAVSARVFITIGKSLCSFGFLQK